MPTWDDLNATRISPIVAYTDGPADGVTLWHWCTNASDWQPTPLDGSSISTRSPLSLADVTAWSCCGLRGQIRDGRWTPA